MTLELINPEDLPTPASYTQVIAATGSRLVFVAGQVADDAQGSLVGPGDRAAQARQVFANVGRSLVAAGAGPEQVTKMASTQLSFSLSASLPCTAVQSAVGRQKSICFRRRTRRRDAGHRGQAGDHLPIDCRASYWRSA